ncbi:MAG: hypothetical protein QM278_09505 [Pseudomonadota bacterium]|nr:hypothetical protein [Pseudomonadota bacterium]
MAGKDDDVPSILDPQEDSKAFRKSGDGCLMGNSSRRTSANQHTLPDHITNH